MYDDMLMILYQNVVNFCQIIKFHPSYKIIKMYMTYYDYGLV